MSIDVTAMCVECTGRYVEWLDCDRHIVDCYRLACYGCGHDNYDCEDQIKMDRRVDRVNG